MSRGQRSVQRGNVLDGVAPICGLAIPLLEGGGRIDGPIPQVRGPPRRLGGCTGLEGEDLGCGHGPAERRIFWGGRGRDDLEKEKGRRGQAPGDWVGADQRRSSSSIPWPVRECEPAECHRFPGDPVHPIPAQQGQILPQYGGKQNTLGALGLPDCCDWRPVGGALVQSPQQRRSVLSPLKQGKFCRVCGAALDRMRSLVCRRRPRRGISQPTGMLAGCPPLGVWLNQHQNKVASRGQSQSQFLHERQLPVPTHDRRESVRLPVSSLLPEAVEQVEHQLLAEKPSIPPVHALQTRRTVP